MSWPMYKSNSTLLVQVSRLKCSVIYKCDSTIHTVTNKYILIEVFLIQMKFKPDHRSATQQKVSTQFSILKYSIYSMATLVFSNYICV